MIDQMVRRWTSTERPLFKGSLIDESNGTVCYCAQGDVLHVAGWSDERLRTVTQARVDREVARLLGISLTHSILLRNVNDQQDGCPQDVLIAPEKILGDNAKTVLSFWRYLETLTTDYWNRLWDREWLAAKSEWWSTASSEASSAADYTAGAMERLAAKRAASWATRRAASYAQFGVDEIQGESLMIECRKAFYFLPKFGFPNPQAVRDWEAVRVSTTPTNG